MALELCQRLPTVVAFTATWCGHCKVLKPHLKLLEEADGVTYHVKEVDSDDKTYGTLLTDVKIEGFPTIVLYAPQVKKFFVYKGPRTAKDIAHALQNKIGTMTVENMYQSGYEVWTNASGAKDRIVFMSLDKC
jgi:protein disulfide-isomerase A6